MKRRRRDPSLRRRKGEITQAQQFELLVGCAAETRHFWDGDDRRAAWDEHRDRLLEESRAGRRPSAWWEFDRDADERPRQGETEVEALLRCGEATQADVDALRASLAYAQEVPELGRRLNVDIGRVKAALRSYDARN